MTGFVIDSIEDAVGALSRVAQLDRRLVARVAYQRFAARRMARDYLRLYARSIARDLTMPTLPDLSPLPTGLPAEVLEGPSPAQLAFAEAGE